jgi:hypothetical protein
MFWNVLLPARSPASIPPFILSGTRPVQLLVAYLVGGLGISLIPSAMVLFFLMDVAVGKRSAVPPEIEIAVGQDGHCLVADEAVLVRVCTATSKAEGRVELPARGPGVLNGLANHGDARNLLLSEQGGLRLPRLSQSFNTSRAGQPPLGRSRLPRR